MAYLAYLCATACLAARLAQASTLPIVDLGYEKHQALVYDSTNDFYNFSNIRYAAPPTGDRRWRRPQHPEANTTTVQTGAYGRICPQANPAWLGVEVASLECQISPSSCSSSSSTSSTSNATLQSEAAAVLAKQDPRITEDCLFLDVVVPRAAFEAKKSSKGVPVIVWLHGGGFTIGYKNQLALGSSSPAGLLGNVGTNSSGVIFVALNYRLGVFGWLGGSEVQANGTANAGLYDQRFALEWVQRHIHKFGGDPKRVTLMGESAGGGSILLHITGYKNGTAPFSRAIPQSPAINLYASQTQPETQLATFLALAKVKTIPEARQLSTAALQLANIEQVGLAQPFGSFVYGPTIDGKLIPAPLGPLLQRGHYDHHVSVMPAHNLLEGYIFTSPSLNTSAAFTSLVAASFPTANASVLAYITDKLYPPVYDGSFGYTSPFTRGVVFNTEFNFACNTYALATTVGRNASHGYLFAASPAIHGQDLFYTFYNASSSSSNASSSASASGIEGLASIAVSNATLALALQHFITSFAETGNPGPLPDGQAFPVYGSAGLVADLNTTRVTTVPDPAHNARCAWWQLGLVV